MTLDTKEVGLSNRQVQSSVAGAALHTLPIETTSTTAYMHPLGFGLSYLPPP